MKDILITLPGFQNYDGLANNYEINLKLIQLLKQNPEKFYDGIKIEYVYDCFPCDWQGGRAMSPCSWTEDSKIIKAITPFLEQGIKIRLNLTNCLLEEKHLKDKNSNHLVKVAKQISETYGLKLGIVINSPLLMDYLEKNYPGLEFVYSTTIGKLSIDEMNKKSKDKVVVVDYNYNNDFESLKKLIHPENIEILVNEQCVPNCPHRKLHFELYSAAQLGRIDLGKNKVIESGCMNIRANNLEDIEAKLVHIDNFIENYLPLGINRLKLMGRMLPKDNLIMTYCAWLVKPEYQEEISKILSAY